MDQILKTVNSLDERKKAIETNFAVFKTKIENNTTQIKQIKVEQDKIRKTITDIQQELDHMREEREEAQRKIRQENLSRELYSKRFNYLINPWETHEQAEKLFRKFLTAGLQIEDPNSIKIADIHRLPQHPVYDKNHRKINRSIIIKFMDVFDK